MTTINTITDIQHGDNSIFASVNGWALEFKGGELPEEDGDDACDNCGQKSEPPADEDSPWQRVLYWSCDTDVKQVCLCSDCLKRT